MNNVLVIIPTYNEADNIRPIVESIERVASKLKAYKFSLLVVDDRSPDGTAKRVKELNDVYQNIQLLSGPKAGLGRAYLRGFKYALKQKEYDIFVMMDADLSHNPSDIPALMKAINQGADYVIGSRYITGGSVDSNWSMLRQLNSRAANYVVHKLVGELGDVADLTAGFKAIRRSAMATVDLSKINVSGYVFQVSLLHAFLEKHLTVKEVPIKFMPRTHGASKMQLKDIIEFLYSAYKLNPNAPIQRLVRFIFVGGCGAIVNLVILSLLVRLGHLEILLAVLSAIEISIIFNFLLNHYYTFRGYGALAVPSVNESSSTMILKLGIFNLGAAGGAAITFGIFSLLFKIFHLDYLMADAIAILAATSWNYWMSTRFVWKAIDLQRKPD